MYHILMILQQNIQERKLHQEINMIANSIVMRQISVRISHSILDKLVQLEKIAPRKIATSISNVRKYYENKDIIKHPIQF